MAGDRVLPPPEPPLMASKPPSHHAPARAPRSPAPLTGAIRSPRCAGGAALINLMSVPRKSAWDWMRARVAHCCLPGSPDSRQMPQPPVSAGVTDWLAEAPPAPLNPLARVLVLPWGRRGPFWATNFRIPRQSGSAAT